MLQEAVMGIDIGEERQKIKINLPKKYWLEMYQPDL